MVKRKWRLLVFCSILLMATLLFLWLKPLFLTQEDIREAIQSTGAIAPLTLIFLQLIQTVIPFVPGGIVTISGGYIFGVIFGTIYSLIGLVLGSFIVFSISKKYFAPKVRNSKNETIRKLDSLLKIYGVPFLFFSRMIPFFPHDILSYIVGSGQISRKKFIMATALGFLPHSFAHNYVGDSVYQGNYGFGFYLILALLIAGGITYLFRDKIIDSLLTNKKKYKSKKYGL